MKLGRLILVDWGNLGLIKSMVSKVVEWVQFLDKKNKDGLVSRIANLFEHKSLIAKRVWFCDKVGIHCSTWLGWKRVTKG